MELDQKRLALIMAAVAAYLEEEAAGEPSPPVSAWAKAGRAQLLARHAQMQHRPPSGSAWRTWAL